MKNWPSFTDALPRQTDVMKDKIKVSLKSVYTNGNASCGIRNNGKSIMLTVAIEFTSTRESA